MFILNCGYLTLPVAFACRFRKKCLWGIPPKINVYVQIPARDGPQLSSFEEFHPQSHQTTGRGEEKSNHCGPCVGTDSKTQHPGRGERGGNGQLVQQRAFAPPATIDGRKKYFGQLPNKGVTRWRVQTTLKRVHRDVGMSY